MSPNEPQSANDYDERTTTAVKAVLIEIGQILASYKGKFAVVGGAVPRRPALVKEWAQLLEHACRVDACRESGRAWGYTC